MNIASRLETSVALPGQIVIGQATYEQVREHYVCEPLGEVQLRGKRQTIRAYRVVKARNRDQTCGQHGLVRCFKLSTACEFRAAFHGDHAMVIPPCGGSHNCVANRSRRTRTRSPRRCRPLCLAPRRFGRSKYPWRAQWTTFFHGLQKIVRILASEIRITGVEIRLQPGRIIQPQDPQHASAGGPCKGRAARHPGRRRCRRSTPGSDGDSAS